MRKIFGLLLLGWMSASSFGQGSISFSTFAFAPATHAGTATTRLLLDSSPLTVTSLIRDASDPAGKTGLVTTSAAHDLQVGERVKVDASGGSPSQFKGSFVIKAVPAANQFRYQMESNPGPTTPTNPTLKKVFGAGRLIIERNTIELVPGADGLMGIELTDLDGTASLAPDYGYGDVIIRDKLIRYVDGAFEPGNTGSGIKVAGAKLVTVRNNLLECAPASPIQYLRCGAVSWFDNRTLDGVLIARTNEITGKPIEEYDAAAEDALVAALAGGT